MSLDKLRSLPEFQNASDAEILGTLSKTAGVPLADVATIFGADTGGKWGNRAGASLDSYQAGLYGVGEAITGGTSLESFFRSGREANDAAANLGRANAQRQGAIMSYKDVGGVGDALDYVGGLAVDSLPYLAESALGGIAGRALLTGGKTALGLSRATAGTVGGVAASYPSAVGDILQNQREEPGGQTNPGAAALGGIPYAALNALGVSGAASRAGGLRRAGIDVLDNMGGIKGGLARTGVAFGKNALEEGIGETGQEMINQGFGRMAVNPDQTLFNPEANERYLESFIGGAALGGVVGGAAGGWRLDDPAKPADLLGSGPTLGLGYSPLAGTPTVFPDGSVALNGEQELAHRYASQEADRTPLNLTTYGAGDGPAFGVQPQETLDQLRSDLGAAAAMAEQAYRTGDQAQYEFASNAMQDLAGRIRQLETPSAQPGQTDLFNPDGSPTYGANPNFSTTLGDYNLLTQPAPIQQRIDQNLGIGARSTPKNYPAQFQAAASEPTNLFAFNPQTQAEIPLDLGQATANAVGDNVQLTPEQANIRANADAAAATRRAAHNTFLGPQNANGAWPITLKQREIKTFAAMDQLRQRGQMTQAAFEKMAGEVQEALQNDDTKYLEATHKNVTALAEGQAVTQPKPAPAQQTPAVAATENVAPSPAPTPTSEQPSVEVPAETGAVAPVTKAVPATRAASQPVEAAGRAAVAPAPQTTQPATVAGIDATKTVAVGRSGRQKQVTPAQLAAKLKDAPAARKRMVMMATGLEETTDATTGAPTLVVSPRKPMTYAQIARTFNVSPQAVQNTLADFGIDEDVITRMQSATAPESVSEEELGINPEENGSGFRVEDSLSKTTGQGLVEDGTVETREQRQARIEADRLLKQAGAVLATEETAGPDEVVADMPVANQALIEANTRAAFELSEAGNAAADWDSEVASWEELPADLRADWIYSYTENLQDNGDIDFAALARDQGRIEDDYRTIQSLQANTRRDTAGLEGPARGQEDRPQIGGPDPGGSGRLEHAAATETQAAPEPDLGTRVRSKLKAAGQNVAKAGLTDEELAEAIRIYDKLGNAAKAKEARAEQEARGATADQPAPTPFTIPAADLQAAIAGRDPIQEGAVTRLEPTTAADRRTNPQGGGGNSQLAEGARTKQSRGSSASGSGGAGLYPAVRHYTVETLTEELKRFVRADALGRAVRVIDSVADIPHWVDTSGVDASTQALTAISNGRATVFLIADRIRKGQAKAVFLHEVGVHLGLERLLPTAVYKKIVGRIQTLRENYLSGADTSVSAMLASAAYDRVVSAHPNTTESADPGLFDSELVAYFVEESVIAGIDPTASTKLDAPLRSWFRTLWASFKSALRRFGYKDASSFTAQDAVDMAYGAARLEVAGTFHGTAANFRRFDHKFMGSGEGAQAFGWGTYLAQRFGIATDYWAADINRKKRNGASPEGGVMRVDSAVMEGDLLDWYAPMSEQSALLEKVKAQMPSDLLAAVEAGVKKPLESMTGADLYEAMVFIGGRGSDLVSRNVRNVRQNAGAAEVASRYLDEVLDVPGIRFFDAASRTPAGVLVYRGDVYTPDDLRNLRKQGGDLGAYASTLRSVLRNGLDAEIRDLEAKVKATSDMLFGVDRDSAARFGVPFDADSAKQRAEAEAMKTFDGQQLAWLQANRGDIEVRTVDRTKNLVVFNDKNIYRVSTRRGNSRERTLFSKSIPSEAAPAGGKKVIFAKPPYMEQAPSELWETAQGALGVLRDWTFTRGAFTRDLLDAAAKMMPAAQTYRDKMQRARVESMKLERDVAAITDAFAALPAHERGTGGRSVNALIRKMTYDNKWAFAPSWVPNVKPDPELAEWFEKGLSADARKVVIGVFQHGHETLKQVQQAALDSIKSEVDPLIADARAKGDMATVKELEKAKVKADGKFRRLMELRGQTPYAPLRRFGNWAVVAKSRMYQDAEAAGDKDQMDKLSRDGKHYHVEFAPNRLAAAARAKKLKAAMGDVSVNHFERSDDKLLYGGESMFKAFSRFRTLAREEMADSEGKVVTALDKTLASMYMTLVAETSARTSEFERKNVSGADGDMMRAFATQGRAMANFIGSLKTSGEIMETLRTLKKQSHQGANQADKSVLYNEIMRRHAMGMNYEPNQLLDKSLAANSYWSLITSPSYFLTNLTQPWVASLPVLAGRFGVGRSTGEMFRAYKEIARIATKLVDNPGAVKDLPKDVQKVVEELLNRGSIDISVGADLGQFTSGGNSLVNAHVERAIRMPRTLAERGEMVNRVATAVAAYRLARGSMPEADAIDYADKVIYETHGDYSAFNAPRVMRNSVGRFATQFRKFQLIQISLYARLFRDAFAKLPSEERFVARKALAYSLGMTFALGGMTAMPGYTAISFILGSVLGLGDDDEPDDPEATLRRALGGGPMADLLIRGVPNLAGINIGSRIGAAGMLSILPYTDLEASRDGYKDILLGLAGPFVGGTLPKALDGLGLWLNGDYYKGLEMMLPRGLGDALKGVRFGTEGVTKRNGDVVLSGDEISFLAAAAQFIGLPTTSITDNQMLRNSQFKADDFYKDRTTQLKRQYVEAYREGDGTKLQEVRQAWMETQEARKRLGYDVQPMSTLLKAPQEQRKREAKPLKTALVE